MDFHSKAFADKQTYKLINHITSYNLGYFHWFAKHVTNMIYHY